MIGEDNEDYDSNIWNDERNGLRDISDEYYNNNRMKRSKYDDINELSPALIEDELSNNIENNHIVGQKSKFRSRDYNNNNGDEENVEPQHRRNVTLIERYEKRCRRDKNEESILNAARQEELERKNIEIQELRQQIAELNEVLEKTHSDLKVFDEENKLLKRAVAIQNSREQRLNEKFAQHEEIMLQASIHIGNLEKRNSELRAQLLLDEPYIDTLEQRPPDVF